MPYTKAEKRMIYGVAMGIKRMYPHYSNYTCIEEALFKCDGRNYRFSITDGMEKEYEAYIAEILSNKQTKPITPDR